MKREISVDRVLDAVMQYYDENEQYYSTAKLPYMKFKGKDISEKLKDKREKLRMYNEWVFRSSCEICTISEVLKLDYEQRERLYSAGRAARKWYKRTNYENCISYELENRLGEYIFGKEKEIWQM